MVRAQPTSQYARRLWFLFEWLLSTRLQLSDAERGPYVPALNPKLQYAVARTRVPRQRILDNLPGSRAFCPLVFRTARMEALMQLDLKARAQRTIDSWPRSVATRAAAFLLLRDSQASYAIEGERAHTSRIEQWGRAIGIAGQIDLSLDELLRLQHIVIGDNPNVRMGLRKDGVFLGTRDRLSHRPHPEHIGAKPTDLEALVHGLLQFERGAARQLDPILAAALLAFGFIYVHPFEDGNGRTHRYLIQHVLAQRKFCPPGIVLPVSAAMLQTIDAYRKVLETYSLRLVPCIHWRETRHHNVAVENDTADFYRYFDATPHAEYLYDCVRRTIEEDLPAEANHLTAYDEARAAIADYIELPQRLADLLILMVKQNSGRLAKRRRKREFATLTDEQVHHLEQLIAETFGLR